MTGYTVHTGTSKRFASGWDRIFGAKKKGAKATSAESASKPAKDKKSTRGSR